MFLFSFFFTIFLKVQNPRSSESEIRSALPYFSRRTRIERKAAAAASYAIEVNGFRKQGPCLSMLHAV